MMTAERVQREDQGGVMLGGFAQALFFISVLVLTMIVGSYGLAFLASVLAVVIEQTASGNDQVNWPDEPTIDRLWRAVPVLWIAAVWIAPAGLLMKVLTHYTTPELTTPLTIIAIGTAFWLFFPVGILSSLSSESPWLPLRPAILGGLFKCLPTTVAFYFVSFFLVGAMVAAVTLTCLSGQMWLPPVAGLVTATLVLIWARLLGRLGWVVSHALAKPPEKKKTAEERSAKPAKKRRLKKRKPKVEVSDPWAKPPKEEEPKQPSRTPWGGVADPVESYGLAAGAPREEEEPKPRPRKDHFPENDTSPYDVTAHEETAKPAENQVAPSVEPDELEMKRHVVIPPPAHPMLQGVYNFPWYSGALRRWVLLWAVISGLVFLIQLMIQLVPS